MRKEGFGTTGFAFLAILLALGLVLPLAAMEDPAEKLDPVGAGGLEDSVRVRRDAQNIPHIFALNDHDAYFMLGWIHAQDRFFQIDTLRRTFSGTSAEMFGAAALPQDVQLRTLGLRRAAEASLAALPREAVAMLDAYAEGVNAWLNDPANPLPAEYGLGLELTKAGVPPWTTVDSLAITKGLAFGLSFDLDDIDLTQALLTFQGTGAALGFDGTALFTQDLYRTAPFDPSISIPDALRAPEGDAPAAPSQLPEYLGERTLGLIEGYKAKVTKVDAIQKALAGRDADKGSNWWIIGGQHTESGYPVLANDPHLALDTPSTFYEVHMRVRRGEDPPMNINGVSFPGTPGVVLGCTIWACWGATVHPMDVTDVYQEQLVLDPATLLPTHTVFDGALEPLVLIPQAYGVNQLGDGTFDNLADSGLGPLDGGLTLVVPRRNNGPIVNIDLSDPANVVGLSVQYTGWSATTEIETLRRFGRVRTMEDFKAALEYFEVGSQNWAFADIEGNIAYFTSAEMPIREDLQNLNAPDGGIPPYFIRDGTHGMQHEWLALENPQPNQSVGFEILPFAEMPQLVNPESGYILNANNDPIGTSLDNNPVNQLRPGGGLYYLSPGYATGFRQGRLVRLVEGALAGGAKLTVDEIAAFQGNNQLLDAEALVPYILDAFANASQDGADPTLAALAADAGIAEAIGRLGSWDYSTPTGIAGGYDPGDDPMVVGQAEDPRAPVAAEVGASTAATIYSAWRGQMVQTVIDGTLALFGLDGLAPGSSLAMSALRNLLDNFETQQGAGVSGITFLGLPASGAGHVIPVAAARDIIILDSLRAALDLLASDTFAAAFGGSTSQDDYLWGNLHRIVLDHALGEPFSVPGPGVLPNLGEGLRGIARAGGFGALDASSHGARADGLDEFMFGSGASRRFVGHMTPDGVVARQVIPGGESGEFGNPFQEDQLLLWLTNAYHPLHLTPADVVENSATFQRFLPILP